MSRYGLTVWRTGQTPGAPRVEGAPRPRALQSGTDQRYGVLGRRKGPAGGRGPCDTAKFFLRLFSHI
jgi:hypothetical protein